VQFPFFRGKLLIRFAAQDALAFVWWPGDENCVFVNPGIIADEDETRVNELDPDVNVNALPHPPKKEPPNQATQLVAGRSRYVLHWEQDDPGKLKEKMF